MAYRRREEKVEAVLWTGDNLREILDVFPISDFSDYILLQLERSGISFKDSEREVSFESLQGWAKKDGLVFRSEWIVPLDYYLIRYENGGVDTMEKREFERKYIKN